MKNRVAGLHFLLPVRGRRCPIPSALGGSWLSEESGFLRVDGCGFLKAVRGVVAVGSFLRSWFRASFKGFLSFAIGICWSTTASVTVATCLSRCQVHRGPRQPLVIGAPLAILLQLSPKSCASWTATVFDGYWSTLGNSLTVISQILCVVDCDSFRWLLEHPWQFSYSYLPNPVRRGLRQFSIYRSIDVALTRLRVAGGRHVVREGAHS